MSGRRRIATVALHSPAVWLVLPVFLGLDVMVALSRGAGWRGELSSLVEAIAPVVMLFSPFLAGLGAWSARQDRALDVSGLLRSCAEGRRHLAVRVSVAAGVPAVLHLLVLMVLGAVSLTTAHVGGWPIGPLLVQFAAFPAFTALGYLIGWFVDHLVGLLVAAAVALLAAYTDYGSPRWPLGFISDGGSGSFISRHPDDLAVLGRLTFCVAVSGLALLAACSTFAAGRSRWIQLSACAGLLLFGVRVVQTHPLVWTPRAPIPVADHCTGERPQVCVLPDYAGLAERAAHIADRTAVLLRSTGASGLPDTFVGWFPSVPPAENTLTIFDPETAYQPAESLVIMGEVVAPSGCPQWRTGVDLDDVGAAEQIVLTWLVGQDPGLSGERG
ncbi:MAG: hypothetical protein ACJ71T_03190 [Actinomycetales bacterium]